MSSVSCWPNSQSWGRYWPGRAVSGLAVIQLFISFAILGLQSAIVAIGIAALCNDVTARYIMGFVCWAFFCASWIATCCVTCCNRSSVGCATYTLVQNILAFIFSCVLIDFDRKFLANPAFDYNPSSLSDASCQLANNDGPDFADISLSLAKGQLAGAVIMLVTSLTFVGIYIYVYIKALNDNRRFPQNPSSSRNLNAPSYPPAYITPQTVLHSAEPPIDYGFKQNTVHSRKNPETVVCHNCGSTVNVGERF